MKSIKVLMFIIFICNSLLFALSNNVLADKYLIAAQRYIKAKEYKRAEKEFEKIFNLGVKIPNDLYYFYAKTLKNSNKLNSALDNFNLYVEKTGRNSKHYQEALSHIVEIEDTIIANEKAEKERIRKEQIRIQQKKQKAIKLKKEKEARKKRKKIEYKEKCSNYSSLLKRAYYMRHTGCGKRSNYFTGYIDNKCYDKAERDITKYSKKERKYCKGRWQNQ